MRSVILEGRYVKPEGFTDTEGLPVPFYGRIRWDKITKEPKKRWKLFNRIPDALKVMLNLIDELSFVYLCKKYPLAIIASAKLERERDEVALKAVEPQKITPSDGFVFTHNAVNLVAAQYMGVDGYYGLGIDHVCSSGLDLIGLADRLIRDKTAEVVLVVAINSMAAPSRTAYHANLGVVSKRGCIRPFDRRRDGTIFADGMAVALLCSEDVAEKEALTGVATVLSYSAYSDAYHMFSLRKDGTGFRKAIEGALNGEQPQVVKAHATATKLNDAVEAKVYRELFGDEPVITALKPIFGHSVTASGLCETLYLLDCLKGGYIPPIATLNEVDGECEGIRLAREKVPFDGGTVLSVAAGFGGFFSAVLLEVGRWLKERR